MSNLSSAALSQIKEKLTEIQNRASILAQQSGTEDLAHTIDILARISIALADDALGENAQPSEEDLEKQITSRLQKVLNILK